MNKAELKKNVGHHVRLRPMAKRFVGGRTGPQLPPVDDDWLIQGFEKDGVRISNNATGHGTVLGFDHIREFATDPVRGHGYGMLILKSQVHIGGCSLWIEPISVGGSVPNPLDSVRGWKRENDPAYIQSLFPAGRAVAAIPQALNGGNPALGFGLLACLCIGVGLLIANA
jgi:hypothetical protein